MGKKRYAIIVAGGSGSRMGGNIAKQFIELGGKPVIVHTIERFLALDNLPEIILVLPEKSKQVWKDYCFENRFTFRHTLVSGGITRFHSVKNALKYVQKGGIVAVHDGVRPFVDTNFLKELYELADKKRAVIPVVNPSDSMRIKQEEGASIITSRDKYVMVQTPQLFHTEVLISAYEQAYSPTFTDDASVVEGLGIKIVLTEGRSTNIKITNPQDLLLAQALINLF